MRTVWVPGRNLPLDGEWQGLNARPSILHPKLEPATSAVNLIFTRSAVVRFFGFFVIVVTGAGQGSWAAASAMHPSWLTSPYPSPSWSGSQTAEMLAVLRPPSAGRYSERRRTHD